MSFLKEWSQRYQAQFYRHVDVWVAVGIAACKASGRRLTYAEYEGFIEYWGGANSYVRRLLVPFLDDEALCRLTEYCMGQAGRELGELEIARDYNDAVQREFAPLLVARLRESSVFVQRQRSLIDKYVEKLDQQLLDLGRAEIQLREAAAWEVQAQDLRDKLVQVERERDQLRAGLSRIEARLDDALRLQGKLP